MISFLQHQALVGDTFPMRCWASKEMAIPCPLPLLQASGSILLLLSLWHLWFLALGVPGDVWFENFRLKFPGALVISTGLYDTHEWLTLSKLCLHLQKYLKNTLLFKIHQGTFSYSILSPGIHKVTWSNLNFYHWFAQDLWFLPYSV